MEKLELLKKDIEQFLQSVEQSVKDMEADIVDVTDLAPSQKAEAYIENGKLMMSIAECNDFVAEMRSIISKY